MKNLFVVTHTESLHHIESRVGGWYDTGLTEKGQQEARLTGERLRSLIADKEIEIFSSDLLRATQTAEVISEYFQTVPVLMPELREMSYGIAEGHPQDWLLSRQAPVPIENRLDFRLIEGAETRRECATRIYRAVDAILSSSYPTQIIVTHGFALTFVVGAWIKMPIENMDFFSLPVSPGSITHLREDDFWRNRGILTLGDRSHLDEIIQQTP